MATDGVKIIDGDIARIIYHTFEESYNNGASIEELKQQYKTDKSRYCFDDETYEICITVYALAFWEIATLSPEMLKEVEEVVGKKATVAGWAEELGEQAGKARQRELDKLLAKISKPRVRPKKRETEKKPAISQEQQQLIDEAENKAQSGQLAQAQTIYKQLLQQNAMLHHVRYKYIELLHEIPKQPADCPSYIRGEDLFAGEKHKKYSKYIVAHTNWQEIETHCRYMLTHRDTDRMTVSGREKANICEWYIFIAGAMSNSLMAQQKYEEAILFIEERINFMLSRKGTGLPWVANCYLDIYGCLLMAGNQQKTDAFIQKYLLIYPDSDASLACKKESLKKEGIEVYLAV